MSPPHHGGGRFPPERPGIAPGQPPSSPVYPQPLPVYAIQAPLHTAPPSKISGPEGKILVFRIPAVPELSLDQLNGQVVSIRLEACVKAEHLILWHNLSELQVLMRLDFFQTASAMKEDVIKTLIEKKQLKKEVCSVLSVLRSKMGGKTTIAKNLLTSSMEPVLLSLPNVYDNYDQKHL